MKVLTISLEDVSDIPNPHIKITTQTPTSTEVELLSWDVSPVKELTHYLLSVISDMDWSKWLQRAVTERAFKNYAKELKEHPELA